MGYQDYAHPLLRAWWAAPWQKTNHFCQCELNIYTHSAKQPISWVNSRNLIARGPSPALPGPPRLGPHCRPVHGSRTVGQSVLRPIHASYWIQTEVPLSRDFGDKLLNDSCYHPTLPSVYPNYFFYKLAIYKNTTHETRSYAPLSKLAECMHQRALFTLALPWTPARGEGGCLISTHSSHFAAILGRLVYPPPVTRQPAGPDTPTFLAHILKNQIMSRFSGPDFLSPNLYKCHGRS